MAHTVKNPPAMQETWVRSPSWEDPLEEGMATHSSILAGEFHGQRSLAGYSHFGRKDSDMIKPQTLSVYVCQSQSPSSSYLPHLPFKRGFSKFCFNNNNKKLSQNSSTRKRPKFSCNLCQDLEMLDCLKKKKKTSLSFRRERNLSTSHAM